MKKLLAYLLLMALALSLFGCSVEPVGPTTTAPSTASPTTTTAPTQTTAPDDSDPFAGMSASFSLFPEEGGGSGYSTTAAISTQTLPRTLDNPDNLPVLTWVCLVDDCYGAYNGRRWSSAAVEELNQMLADRNMPFRVQFKLISSTSAANNWFGRADIDKLIDGADLIYGFTNKQDLPTYFAPITQYVTGEGQLNLANAVGHERDWRNAAVGEEIYAIPAEPVLAKGNGWWVDTAFMEKCGLTAEDLSRNFWEMDEIFAKMYRQNNNKPFLYYQSYRYTLYGTQHGIQSAFPWIHDAIAFTDYQSIGASFGIDLTAETPVVVNILETELVRNIQEAFLRYQKAGYVTDNYSLRKAYYYYTFGSEPYYIEGGATTCIPVSETMYDNEKMKRMTGIVKDSQYQQEAAALLELIAEDEEFRMQLFYGKEGRDYKIEDGLYTLTGYSLDFLSPLAFFSGMVSDIEKLNYEAPSTESLYFAHIGKTQLESYRDNMDALRYCCCPVIFDYSGYEEELENIAKVMGKYYFNFATMNMDTYNKMLEQMELAGSRKIMAELQRQLDAWVAANPDWNPLG